MRWRIEPERYALAGYAAPPDADDLALLDASGSGQIVREGGETTLLVPMTRLPELERRRPEARCERDLLWVRFEQAMDWELVGFLALVTGELARVGVPVGAVCGYSRDHLFVASRYESEVRAVLLELFPESSSEPG